MTANRTPPYDVEGTGLSAPDVRPWWHDADRRQERQKPYAERGYSSGGAHLKALEDQCDALLAELAEARKLIREVPLAEFNPYNHRVKIWLRRRRDWLSRGAAK